MQITRRQFGLAMLLGAAAIVFTRLFGSFFSLFREKDQADRGPSGFRARYWSGGNRLAG
jgi:hypothetical protein